MCQPSARRWHGRALSSAAGSPRSCCQAGEPRPSCLVQPALSRLLGSPGSAVTGQGEAVRNSCIQHGPAWRITSPPPRCTGQECELTLAPVTPWPAPWMWEGIDLPLAPHPFADCTGVSPERRGEASLPGAQWEPLAPLGSGQARQRIFLLVLRCDEQTEAGGLGVDSPCHAPEACGQR